MCQRLTCTIVALLRRWFDDIVNHLASMPHPPPRPSPLMYVWMADVHAAAVVVITDGVVAVDVAIVVAIVEVTVVGVADVWAPMPAVARPPRTVKVTSCCCVCGDVFGFVVCVSFSLHR